MDNFQSRYDANNGSSFNPGQTVLFDIPQQKNKPILDQCYLQFETTMTASGGTPSFGRTGAYSVIQKIRVSSAGQLLQECQYANYEMGKLVLGQDIGNGQNLDELLYCSNQESGQLCQLFLGKLMGFFDKSSTYPLHLASLQIEITLQSAALALQPADATPLAGSDYSIVDPRVVFRFQQMSEQDNLDFEEYLNDKLNGDGVELNFLDYDVFPESVSASETLKTINLNSITQHRNCVALNCAPINASTQVEDATDKFIPAKNNNDLSYSFNLNGVKQPNQDVDLSKNLNSVQSAEIDHVMKAINLNDGKGVLAWNNLYSDYFSYARRLAPRGQSIDMNNKQAQLTIQYAGSGNGSVVYCFCYFIKTVVFTKNGIRTYS